MRTAAAHWEADLAWAGTCRVRGRRPRLSALGLLMVLLHFPAWQSPGATERNLFRDYDGQTFPRLVLAQQPINSEAPDTNLLAAAVFHETNQRRKAHGLPVLTFHAGAAQAAAIQAAIMAERGVVTHENPGHPGRETLKARLKFVGLRPRFAAENVATAFGLQYTSGKPFYVRTVNDRRVFSYEPDGEAMRVHTYLSFAKVLVDQWMQSPGHRKNILTSSAGSLGTSCQPGTSSQSMPIFYCVQVFIRESE
jgi:uncharacterized protein YkwD